MGEKWGKNVGGNYRGEKRIFIFLHSWGDFEKR
jgi:hypothetical protein